MVVILIVVGVGCAWAGVGNLDLSQDIHIHLDGESPGKGPDVGAGVVDGDMTSINCDKDESCECLKMQIAVREKKLKTCNPGNEYCTVS